MFRPTRGNSIPPPSANIDDATWDYVDYGWWIYNYPRVRRADFSTVYHSKHEILDPYRWLEDATSNETKQFIIAQNKSSRDYLDKYDKRAEVHEKLQSMWNFSKTSVLYKHGNNYYFFKNSGLQNQNILYRQEGLYGEPQVFFDPNTLSSDGTVSLHSYKFSEDSNVFAYSLSENDSDWVKIYFKNAQTGENYPDVLENVKFSSIAWTHDNKGIFYAKYPDRWTDTSVSEQFLHQKLYYHVLNTEQADDTLAVEFPDEPDMRIGAEVSDCGRWLILSLVKGCKNNLVYVCNLKQQKDIVSRLFLQPIVLEFEADYEYVTNQGNMALFRTNYKAPNYCLIKIDLNNPEKSNWKTVIPEHEQNILDWATPIDEDKLVVCYIKNVAHCVRLYSSSGVFLSEFVIDRGTITGFSGKKNHKECFFRFTSFLNPGRIYRVDFNPNEFEVKVFKDTIIDGFDPQQFEVTQVFYNSADGVRIPMYLIQRSGLFRDPTRPCLLYGYGGFNVSLLPTFSIPRIVFMKNFDGLIAIANIRGGGEYGERWHNAGRLLNKQNSFTDFQYAMKYLVQEKHTSVNKLAIQGGSNGGLLVTTCMNQARDLFGAAIAQVPVTDMLRFHKHTIGYAWTSDYGCADEETHFKNLLSFSPLHNITSIDSKYYPPILVLTADHDDRVVPSHSFKYIATLQSVEHCNKEVNPMLLYVDTKSGHGSGKPTSKQIWEWTDIFCFLARTLQINFVNDFGRRRSYHISLQPDLKRSMDYEQETGCKYDGKAIATAVEHSDLQRKLAAYTQMTDHYTNHLLVMKQKFPADYEHIDPYRPFD